MGETFKQISNYNGVYSVSNLGNIRNNVKNKLLKPRNTGLGYMIVSLYKDNKQKHHKVHRLVMAEFVGHCELQVDHINGIRGDNRLVNLRYCTPRQNKVYSVLDRTNMSSIYLGVTKYKQRWLSQAVINGKSKYIGIFNCEFAAHVAYINKTK